MSKVPSRILIVRPSALGDVARTVPALVSLKRAYPDAQIDWLVNDGFVDTIRCHPGLHEAIPFPRKRLSRFGWSLGATRDGFRFFRELRRRGYDAVYDLQGLGRSGWLTWITHAAKRVGPADARELGWLGYNRRVKIDSAIRHTVDRMLAILESDGVAPVRDLRLYSPPEEMDWVRRWCAEQRLESGRFAVIAPTAKWESKRWPMEKFAALIPRLKDVEFESCVVVGAESEKEQTRPLIEANDSGVRRIDMVGRTSVGQLMALISSSGLVVANDSAALHLGVGLGTRCVGFFGPTDPAEVGPYRYEAGVIAAAMPSGVNYRSVDPRGSGIGSISVDEAMEGVRRVLHTAPPGSE